MKAHAIRAPLSRSPGARRAELKPAFTAAVVTRLAGWPALALPGGTAFAALVGRVTEPLRLA